MRNKLFIILLVLYALTIDPLIGQKISGMVIDSDDSLALAYVNIYLSTNTAVGTVSNNNGYFELKIPDDSFSGKLIFSSIGYVSKSIELSNVSLDEEFIISLKPKALKLDEMVLLSDDVKPEKILRKAINRIYRNYSKQPYQSTFFYRQTDFKGNFLSRVIEAEILVEDKGYLGTYEDLKVYLSEMRKTPDLGTTSQYAGLMRAMSDQMGSPRMAFNFDHVRNASQSIDGFAYKPRLLQNDSLFNPFKYFDIKLEKAVLNNNDEIVYVLHLSHIGEKRAPSKGIGKETDAKELKKNLNRYSKLPKELKQTIINREKQQETDSVKRIARVGILNDAMQIVENYWLYIDAQDFGIHKIDSKTYIREYINNEDYTESPFSSTSVVYKKTDKYRLSSLTASIPDLQKGSASDGNRQFKKYELLSKLPTEKPIESMVIIAPQTNLFHMDLPYNSTFWEQANKIKSIDFKINYDDSLFGSSDLEKYFIKN